MPGAPALVAPEHGRAMNLLHVASEIFPWVKTGGLGDVVGALPAAQRQAGLDARLLLPGYPALVQALQDAQPVAALGPAFGAARITLLQGTLGEARLPAWILDAPWFYDRDAGPYQDGEGADWADNLPRFALLGWAAAQLAAGGLAPGWAPDVVHAHDWHAGLACAYLHAHPARRAGTVFTIHNLAFAGSFALDDFHLLGLPGRYVTVEGIEFHHQLSFMKAGLQLADRVTTVSPHYAQEIATPGFGCGFEGVVRARGATVSGVLNGIDTAQWNPATDPALPARYDRNDLGGKAACRHALRQAFGLDPQADAQAPLFCVVSRLTAQKGIDLLLQALPALLECGAQLALQGTGDAALEQALRAAAAAHPGRIGVRIAYDEGMAHRLIAGADAILVPSRFEPCGLTQLYALRYGTLPLVHRVGGLADTVADADEHPPHAANGIVFDSADATALARALQRACALWRDTPRWQALVRNAMAEDHSWQHAARGYEPLYRQAVGTRGR